MLGADYFTELHFAYRGSPTKEEQLEVARFLANLTEYPFMHNLKLDWWERLANPGNIPLFSSCKHLLLHPALVQGGLELIDDPDGPVKLLFVIPITADENHTLKVHGRQAFMEYLEANEVDIIAPRA